jgi:hypothetical protein
LGGTILKISQIVRKKYLQKNNCMDRAEKHETRIAVDGAGYRRNIVAG